MLDALGTEIHEGDVIVTPGYGSSSLWLNFAVVVKVEPEKLIVDHVRRDSGWVPTTSSPARRTAITALRRIVVLRGEAEAVIRKEYLT